MTPTPIHTTTPERPRTATTPVRRVATTTLGTLLWPAVWFAVAIVAVVAVGLSLALARFGLFEQGVWTGISSISRWVAAICGLMVASAMRHLVANGITRRDGFRGLTIGVTGVTIVAGAVVAIGAGLEWLVFAGIDDVTTPVTSLAGVGVTWLAATTQLLAYLVSGALIGVAFATLPWTPAVAAVVPSLVPAAVTEALWGAALADVDLSSGPFQAVLRGTLDPGVTAGVLAVVACVVTVAVGVAVLRRGVVNLQFPA